MSIILRVLKSLLHHRVIYKDSTFYCYSDKSMHMCIHFIYSWFLIRYVYSHLFTLTQCIGPSSHSTLYGIARKILHYCNLHVCLHLPNIPHCRYAHVLASSEYVFSLFPSSVFTLLPTGGWSRSPSILSHSPVPLEELAWPTAPGWAWLTWGKY